MRYTCTIDNRGGGIGNGAYVYVKRLTESATQSTGHAHLTVYINHSKLCVVFLHVAYYRVQ